MKTFAAFTQISPMETGWIIVIVGMSVVFFSLLLLYAVFQFVVPLALDTIQRALEKNGSPEPLPAKATTGEEIAAVAAAVYMIMLQTHDEENAILTIHKAKKDYSPWSSKIYMTHNIKTKMR